MKKKDKKIIIAKTPGAIKKIKYSADVEVETFGDQRVN